MLGSHSHRSFTLSGLKCDRCSIHEWHLITHREACSLSVLMVRYVLPAGLWLSVTGLTRSSCRCFRLRSAVLFCYAIDLISSPSQRGCIPRRGCVSMKVMST